LLAGGVNPRGQIFPIADPMAALPSRCTMIYLSGFSHTPLAESRPSRVATVTTFDDDQANPAG
jgi:hypothetical protein